MSLLSVRLSDCAHEFSSSLCDAFIAHFEGVQFVLYKLASEGGFGRAVGCFPGGFSCQGGRGGVETWWGRRLVPYTDESALFCPDSSINNEAKCERAASVPT